MRLDELIGVRRYRTRTLGDWLRDFERVGGWWDAGSFGTVVGHPKWKFVFKFFPDDECYLDYVNWAIDNPDPCAPVFYGRPKEIVPFYRRPSTENKVWVVKMERLLPIVTPPVPDIQRHILGSERVFNVIGDRQKEEAYLAANPMPVYLNTLNEYRNAWIRHPQLRGLCEFFWNGLAYAQIPCQLDLHWKNVMKRHDGSYVLTDPFWYGENPMQVHNRMMKAELGHSDEAPPMVDGRKLYSGRKEQPLEPWEPQDIPF